MGVRTQTFWCSYVITLQLKYESKANGNNETQIITIETVSSWIGLDPKIVILRLKSSTSCVVGTWEWGDEVSIFVGGCT